MNDEPSLDERIALLTSLLTDPADDADVPALQGYLGGSQLERFERDGTTDELDASITRLIAALAMAPDHPDAMYWYHGLGVAYTHRAARTGEIADHHRGVHWLRRLHDRLSDSDEERDYAAVLLMDAHWDRFQAIRHGGACDAQTALDEADRVVSAMAGLAVRGDPELTAYARLLRGLAHIARFDEHGDREDLDGGIERLAGALDVLTPDSPRHTLAGGWLVDALRRRAELDQDPSTLDLSIATGDRFLSVCGPGDFYWDRLNAFQAIGYEERWYQSAARADLDRAIELWRVALAPDDDVWPAAHCGDLLRQRAELTEDAADLPEAIRLLDVAARAATVDDPDRWLRWLELGQAYQTQWHLAHTPDSLPAAAACVDRALSLRLPGGDARILVHNRRILVAFDALKHENAQPHTTPPRGAFRLRQCLTDAQVDLDHGPSGSPAMRALSARLLGYGELFLVAHEMKDVEQMGEISDVASACCRARHGRWAGRPETAERPAHAANDAAPQIG
jgi:tetratricopeptide (TPR) repeat protein